MHLHDVLREEFKRFNGRALDIVETGTIRGRGEASFVGDGHSTLFFANYVVQNGGRLVTIDLNTRTVPHVLSPAQLERTMIFEGHSVDELERLSQQDSEFDVIFLDSDNDPDLIWAEFSRALELVREGGLILIDDVRMPHHLEGDSALAKEGDRVVMFLQDLAAPYRLTERVGWATYRTGVLAIDY